MTTTAPDPLTTWTTGWADAVQRWVDQSQSLWEQWGVPAGRPAPAAAHRRDRECAEDACHCCVPEADVVLHARAGERRVVPFRLHNRWRREREVTLAVGPWHACGGDGLAVEARFDRETLTLGPCEDRIVLLTVAVGVAAGHPGTADAGPEKANRASDRASETARGTTRDTTARADVGCCTSAYADVRFEGCARPQRVAVVVKPADCDPVEATCDCGCC